MTDMLTLMLTGLAPPAAKPAASSDAGEISTVDADGTDTADLALVDDTRQADQAAEQGFGQVLQSLVPTTNSEQEAAAAVVQSELLQSDYLLESLQLGSSDIGLPGGNQLPDGGQQLPAFTIDEAIEAALSDTMVAANLAANLAADLAADVAAESAAMPRALTSAEGVPIDASVLRSTEAERRIGGKRREADGIGTVSSRPAPLPHNAVSSHQGYQRPTANESDTSQRIEHLLQQERSAFADAGAKVFATAGNTGMPGQLPLADAGNPLSMEHSLSLGNQSVTTAPAGSRADMSLEARTAASNIRSEIARVAVPFNQTAWGEDLGRQLTMLVSRNFEHVQIQLEPPELGPLQVRIQIQNDQVSLQFTSAHASVRDAVEQTVARLQQLFSDEGMELVDVNVSDQDARQQQESSAANASKEDLNEQEDDDILTQSATLALDDGKIDYFI